MRKLFALILCAVMLILPVAALASGLSSAGELAVDTGHIYPGMEKSYAQGYVPAVEDGAVKIVLPLRGSVRGGVIAVEPEIPREGPFIPGNWLFEVRVKTHSVVNMSGKTEKVNAYLVTLDLPLSGSDHTGTYDVGFNVAYRTAEDIPMEQRFSVAVALGGESGTGSAPFLRITGADITPDTVGGDEEIKLKATIENTGSAARNITVRAEPEDEDIVLTSDLNGEFIERLAAGETAGVELTFHSRLHAKGGEHRVRVTAVYEGAGGQSFNTEAVFRFAVEQQAEIRLDEPTLPDSVESGSSFTLPVGVYNPSDASAYNIRAKLSVEGLICGSALFEKLAPGEQAEKTLNVIVTEIGGGKKYGRTEGKFEVTYEDENGAEHKLSVPVDCSITEPQGVTPAEEAKMAEEQMRQNTLSKWWISILAAVAVIAILCSIIVVGKLARQAKIK